MKLCVDQLMLRTLYLEYTKLIRKGTKGRPTLEKFFRILTITMLFSLGVVAVTAQDATATGEPGEDVSLLFAQTASSGSIATNGDGTYTLTLEGVGPTLWFTDRPERKAGHMTTAEFAAGWAEGADAFADDPPNAVLEIGETTHVLELLDLIYDEEAGTLTYTVQSVDASDETTTVLETSDLSDTTFETAALFIDHRNCKGWFRRFTCAMMDDAGQVP